MLYLSNFKLSSTISGNPNIYPDHVFRHMAGEVLLFDRITVLYGSNGSGKSTLLNLIANKLGIAGAERMTSYGHNAYAQRFIEESSYQLGHDDQGVPYISFPTGAGTSSQRICCMKSRKYSRKACFAKGCCMSSSFRERARPR